MTLSIIVVPQVEKQLLNWLRDSKANFVYEKSQRRIIINIIRIALNDGTTEIGIRVTYRTLGNSTNVAVIVMANILNMEIYET